jgi:predicted Zn-dependent protease
MVDNSDYGPDLQPIPLNGSDQSNSRQEAMVYQCFHMGDVNKADQMCRYLLAQNPRQPSITHLWGIIAFHQNDMGEAVRRLRRAVNGFEDPPPLFLLNLGLALYRARELDEAIQVLQFACEKEPEQLDFSNKTDAILLEAGRLDEAEARIQKSLQIKPMDMHAMEVARKIQAKKAGVSLVSPDTATQNITDYTCTISARTSPGCGSK